MPRGPKSCTVQVVMSKTLADAIELLAERDQRSVSAWCKFRLREAVDEFLGLSDMTRQQRFKANRLKSGLKQGGSSLSEANKTGVTRSVPQSLTWRG